MDSKAVSAGLLDDKVFIQDLGYYNSASGPKRSLEASTSSAPRRYIHAMAFDMSEELVHQAINRLDDSAARCTTIYTSAII
jgi:hypothetical protein